MARPVVLALDARVAVDEFDHRHRGGIPAPVAGLQHPRVAAGAALVAGRQHVEQLLDHRLIAHARGREPARVQIAALGEGDVSVHHPLQILGLVEGGNDLLVQNEGGRQVGEHRLAVGTLA